MEIVEEMSLSLRFLLFIMSGVTLLWVIRCARKNNIHSGDVVTWVVFYAFVLGASIFPSIIIYIAKLVGVVSAANFVFLIFIFFLIIYSFILCLRLNALEMKLYEYIKREAVKDIVKIDLDKR